MKVRLVANFHIKSLDKMRSNLFAAALAGLVSNAVAAPAKAEPFLTQVNNQTWIIGNDVWNMTQGLKYGVKLYYKDRDLVGNAVGHYVSYSTRVPRSPLFDPQAGS